MPANDDVLIQVDNLTKHFPVKGSNLFRRQANVVRAVDGISFQIIRGETLGLVGESGCGKSTTGQVLLRLESPTAGRVVYDGVDLVSLDGDELRRMRRRMQIIFQDPYASLNPRHTVAHIIGEPLLIHESHLSRAERQERVQELLSEVGLNPDHLKRYPHEFSGGQRQRIGIARALVLEPEFIVCDEPISALDVSIQAQIVNLLKRLQSHYNLTFLFIAHDLSMVQYISDRVAVMYLGHLMELAPRDELYDNPLHPYTQALFSAIPVPNPRQERQREPIILSGDTPSPVAPPSGCPFHTRCPLAEAKCSNVVPEWRTVSPGHWVACHLV